MPGQRQHGRTAGTSMAAGLSGSRRWRRPVSAYAPGLPSPKAGSVMSVGQASLAARWLPVISADRCRDLRIRSIGGNCRFLAVVGKLWRNEGPESRLGSALAGGGQACFVSRQAISSDIGAHQRARVRDAAILRLLRRLCRRCRCGQGVIRG